MSECSLVLKIVHSKIYKNIIEVKKNFFLNQNVSHLTHTLWGNMRHMDEPYKGPIDIFHIFINIGTYL